MYEIDQIRRTVKYQSNTTDSERIKNIEKYPVKLAQSRSMRKEIREMVNVAIKIKRWGTESNTQEDARGWTQSKKEDNTTKNMSDNWIQKKISTSKEGRKINKTHKILHQNEWDKLTSEGLKKIYEKEEGR